MKPIKAPWTWLLAVLFAVVVVGLAFLVIRPFGTPQELRDRVAAALADWTGASVSLSEPLRVRYFPPSIHGGLILTNATKLPSVTSVTAPKFSASLSLPSLLLGTIKIGALRLDKPTVTLIDPAADKPPEQSTAARLISFLSTAPATSLRIHGGTLKRANGKPLLRKLDLRLSTRGQIGAMEATGSFVFRGEPARFSFDSGKPVMTDLGSTSPASIKFTSAPLTARFAGTLHKGKALEGNGDLELRTPGIRQVLAWLGHPLPAGASLKNAYASGDVHWSGTTLTFEDGTFGFDGNEAVGLFALSIGARPRIEGTLAFEDLSLDPYLPSADMKESPPLDWVLLKHVDADLRISAGEVLAEGLRLGHGALTINAKNEKISSEIGGISLCGGEAEGRLDLDLSAPRTKASLNGSIANIVIEDCLKSLMVDIPIKGSGTLKADVSTGGKTRAALVRGLTGTIEVEAADGVVPIDFAALSPNSAVHGTIWRQDSWTKGAGTAFSALSADCSLSAGHLWCQSCRIKTGNGVVSGAGGMDIAQQTLDWDFRIADPDAPADMPEPVMDSLPRVSVIGTLSAPLIEGASPSSTAAAATETDQESLVETPR